VERVLKPSCCEADVPNQEWSASARRTRNRWDSRGPVLRNLVPVATCLALGILPLGARATDSGAAAPAPGFHETLEVGTTSVEVQVHTWSAPAGASSVAGDGSIRASLPGEGHLSLQLPYVVGRDSTVGNVQLAASYDLAKESRLVPSIAVVAHVDLPTAPGTRAAHPGVKATAAKRLGSGVIQTIRAESELWTEGPDLALSYRALIATTFRLRAATTGSLEFISLHPAGGPVLQDEFLAQLGLSQKLDPATTLHLGAAAGLVDPASPFRVTLGIEHRF
jgi:hypothetical protein